MPRLRCLRRGRPAGRSPTSHDLEPVLFLRRADDCTDKFFPLPIISRSGDNCAHFSVHCEPADPWITPTPAAQATGMTVPMIVSGRTSAVPCLLRTRLRLMRRAPACPTIRSRSQRQGRSAGPACPGRPGHRGTIPSPCQPWHRPRADGEGAWPGCGRHAPPGREGGSWPQPTAGLQ